MRNNILNKFSQKLVIASILSAALLGQTQAAPIVAGSVLGVDQGTGSGPNTPCATGSCFAMEIAPDFFVWTDVGPGTDGGIIVGKSQASGGQENQPTPKDDLAFTTPGEVTNAWEFFGSWGTFSTPQGATNIFSDQPCTGAACIGLTELNSWNWAWNGSSMLLGSANGCLGAQCTPDQLAGIFISDWAVNNANGTYRLNYDSVVPNGDSTGFGNVLFTLILRGVIVPDGSALPEANFDTPAGIVVNQSVQFTDTSRFIGNGISTASLVSWLWDFGDGSTSTQQNPMYAYTQAGSYTVSLTVGDDQANVNTSSQDIVVNPIPTPTPTPTPTFTPTPTIPPTPSPTPTPTFTPPPIQAIPIVTGSILGIDQGVGSGNNTSCTTGSCFGMEVAPGFIVWTDFGSGTDGGIIVGKNQASGGQENQPTPKSNPAFTTPGEMTNAWEFFNRYGTFSTPQGAINIFNKLSCAGAACIGLTELSSWDWIWNGFSVPLGSANGCLSARCTTDQLAGIFVSDWAVNNADGTYRLSYGSVVPDGDSSRFGNVPFRLILRGVIVPDGSTLLEASFDRPIGIVVNQPVQFTDTSGFIGNGISAASLISWLWDFGDGSTSTQQSPVHTYTQVNDYAVTLTVKDDQANVDALIQVITVNPMPAPSPPPTQASIVAGSVLDIDQGVGSTLNTPCTTGSCFAMEIAPGFVVWIDFGSGTDGGIVVGKNQLSGGAGKPAYPEE